MRIGERKSEAEAHLIRAKKFDTHCARQIRE